MRDNFSNDIFSSMGQIIKSEEHKKLFQTDKAKLTKEAENYFENNSVPGQAQPFSTLQEAKKPLVDWETVSKAYDVPMSTVEIQALIESASKKYPTLIPVVGALQNLKDPNEVQDWQAEAFAPFLGNMPKDKVLEILKKYVTSKNEPKLTELPIEVNPEENFVEFEEPETIKASDILNNLVKLADVFADRGMEKSEMLTDALIKSVTAELKK